MIAHLMTSVSRGGLELYVRELIIKLHGAGMRQVVVCDSNSFMVEEMRTLGIAIEFIPTGSRYSFTRMARLRAIDRSYSILIWHSHQRDDMILVALAFFFRKSFRHIFSLYMGFARKQDLFHRSIYARLEKLVTTSHLMNSLALERLPIRADQIQCIRYGRDHKAFQVPAAKVKAIQKTLGLKAKRKLVISLGRLDPMKGVREFADAAHLMDDKRHGKFLFVQIGERTIVDFDADRKPKYLPESEDVYQRLLAVGKNTSCFRLFPFQKDFIPFLLAADYFVLGSYDEMYSLSLIDAMMANCFVIGTNNGGTVEQLAGGHGGPKAGTAMDGIYAAAGGHGGPKAGAVTGTSYVTAGDRGLLIEAKSAAAIAEAINWAERNSALRKKMQKVAYNWVMKEHTWKHVLPQWLALYKT